MNYRPSESFRMYSNKKAQKKAGTYIDALSFYAKRAKEAEKRKCINCLGDMTGIYAICRNCRKVRGGDSV